MRFGQQPQVVDPRTQLLGTVGVLGRVDRLGTQVPAAKAAFEALKSQPRYHILHQLLIAKTEKTRAARIARFIAQLQETNAQET